MPNVASRKTIEPAKVTLDDVDGRHVLTAHRMIEQYLGGPRTLSKVIATYTITNQAMPLAAVDSYPVNKVITVTDVNNRAIEGVDNDDRYVWLLEGSWPSTVVVQYYGGIEQQVYDAIIRQANVLADREDTSPELTTNDITELKTNYDPRFRSGLSSDVKQMLFPFRVIGF